MKNASIDAVTQASQYAIEYVRDIRGRRVSPSPNAMQALENFNEPLPQHGCDAKKVIDLLHRLGSPATTATTGGRFFGLVTGGSTPAAMGANILAAAWDQCAILDATAPSAIHLERIAGKWIVELLDLPRTAHVGFATGSSMANFIGLAAARHTQYQKLGVDITKSGLANAPALRIVVSEQAHVTIFKALALLGFGTDQIQRVPCDNQGRISAEAFPTVGPDTIVCLQAGNVNSGACDPFSDIIPKARNSGAWVHIDGAFGLWAAASPTTRALVRGVELADSWAVDAHKWLNTPYDCGLAICRDPKTVHNVMTTQAPYLAAGTLVPPKDMMPEFSRRARGVEVWAAIKEMGQSGIADLIERCCKHAQRLALGLKQMGFEILNDVALNQVVAAVGTQEQTARLASLIQEEGECWFGTTYWRGRHAIRLSVSSWATTDDDVDRALAAIERARSFST